MTHSYAILTYDLSASNKHQLSTFTVFKLRFTVKPTGMHLMLSSYDRCQNFTLLIRLIGAMFLSDKNAVKRLQNKC